MSIFIYYVSTVISFITFTYYFLEVVRIDNIYILGAVLMSMIFVCGIFISKLAVDPLMEYITSMQRLSRETLHELNLPVSTITTNIHMLQKNLKDEKSLKRLDRINTACDMLKDRYNDLDYLIKMQSKEDVKESFHVDELVRERVEFLKRIYPYMIFKLSLDGLNIISDKKGFSKVIDNIIDNAVKYSKNSKDIDIKIKNNTLFIQDFGIGMDEVEVLKIFDNYYQSNENMQGFGIGLNMVKRFCDKNNINITFKSSLNVGTVVELKFKKIEG